MSHPSRWATWRAGAVAAALLVSACNVGDSPANEAAEAPPHPTYAAVARGRVDIQGGLIQIAAQRDAIIQEVRVEEGDRVRRGQVLAVQDSRAAEVNVRQSQAEAAEARGRLPQLRIQLRAAEREMARLTRLVSDGASPPRELDEARDRVRDLREQAAQAGRAIETAQTRVAVQRFEVEQRVIRAPVDGVIARRLAQPGAGASTLNVSTLFTLIPDAPRIVRAEVEERYAAAVTPGQAVQIAPEFAPDQAYRGTVQRRGQVLGQKRPDASANDPNERVDERVVEVVIESRDLPLLIGQRVLVRFLKASPPA